MSATITLQDAQARLPELVHQLTQGEELAITEGDKVVARIVGERPAVRQRPGPGLCKGMITIVSDDEDHLRDFAEYTPLGFSPESARAPRPAPGLGKGSILSMAPDFDEPLEEFKEYVE